MGRGRRVVVTGIGLICPTGIGTENAWKAILAGRSGIGPVTLFDATPFPCRIAGEVPPSPAVLLVRFLLSTPSILWRKRTSRKPPDSSTLPWPPPSSQFDMLVSI